MTAAGPLPSSGVPGRLSVVIATLNEAKFIRETLESVLAQDWPDIQVHVQDGGSTDGTLDIVREYPGVRLVTEPDGGVPDAFNRGIRATDGEYVMVVDDPVFPGAIPVLLNALRERPEAGFVYGDSQFIDASGSAYLRLNARPFDLDDMFWGNFVATQSVIMRRSALDLVGLYRTDVINADWELWIRMGARLPSVYVPQVLASYRVHDGSTTVNNMDRFAWSVEHVAATALKDPVVVAGLRRGVDRAWAGSHLNAASLYVYADRRGRAATLTAQALRRYPRALATRRGAGAILALAVGTRLYRRIRNRGRGAG